MSTTNVEKLARMANQIAANFDYGSNTTRAVELTEVAALALTTARRPGAAPQMSDTGGDAG